MEKYALFNYWLENIVFLAIFLVYELVLVIPVYLKNIFIIFWASPYLFTKLVYAATWVFFGPFFEVYIVLLDCFQLFKLYSKINGCKAEI